MAEAVADAIRSKRHLVVQAGTGTGKTLAYLVPAVLLGAKCVVATATKALQDQLAAKDLPFLEEHLPDFSWSVLKGRSNYVCLQRLREFTSAESGPAVQGAFELADMNDRTRRELRRIATWVGESRTGDMAELDWSPSDAAWQAVSVGSDECPGKNRCPLGEACFAELARARAASSDVIVVNLHLYGLHVGSDGMLLPEHDVVIVDEAHQLEDVMSDTVGLEIGAGRFHHTAAVMRRFLDDPATVSAVGDAGGALADVLAPWTGKRLPQPMPPEINDVLAAARLRVGDALAAIGRVDPSIEEAKQRKLRAQTLGGRLAEVIDAALTQRDGHVAFVSGTPQSPRLEIAPLDIAPTLKDRVWNRATGVLTSATIPTSLVTRVGLPAGATEQIDVGSPFDYERQAMLYCALHLPDPRSAGFAEATHDELAALIVAAGGRTLALFTSWKAMDAAAAALRDRVDHPILTQRDLPKTALVRAFSSDESTCLFATAGFFQGVDIPGRTLSLVTIDRLPFPRPDDPLLSARREAIGGRAFAAIDVPRAATLLAQATGRLIRTAADRGVVAVLDRRLGTASYRWDIVRALPPMRRTRQRAEAEEFLRAIVA